MAAGYKFRLIPSYGWLGLRRLDMSCDWLRLEFRRLDTSCGWLEFQRLDTSCSWLCPHDWLEFRRLHATLGWFHPAADSNSGGSIRLKVDSIMWLTWVLCFNISSKFKDLFCKIHHFLWFVFSRLISVTIGSGFGCCFKNFEEAWRSFKTLARLILIAAADLSCDGCFETYDQSTTSRILAPMPPW